MSLFPLLVCTCFALNAFAAPYTPSLPPRDTQSAVPIPPSNSSELNTPRPNTSLSPPPAFNATILDHTGADITSTFQIRLYHEPTETLANTSSLNDRQGPSSRLITRCPNPSMTFVTSSCNYQANVAHSLQGYTVFCRRDNGAMDRLTGDCEADEKCVAGFLPQHTIGSYYGGTAKHWPNGVPIPKAPEIVASCVKGSQFGPMPIPLQGWESGPESETTSGDASGSEYLPGSSSEAESTSETTNNGGGKVGSFSDWLAHLGGKRISIVVAGEDGVTPVEVDSLDVEVGVDGRLPVEGEKGVQSKTCTNCLDLETGVFAEGSNSLKLQTKLLAEQGAVAAAGILFVAIMSG